MSQKTASLNSPILIVTTCASVDEAMNIASALVEGKHVACAQIQNEITSVYEWRGKTETSKEIPLYLKTTHEHWEVVSQMITSMHSYEVPEIIAIPIVEISNQYHQWIVDTVKKQVLV